MANGWGGPRPRSGRKPATVRHEIILRDRDPQLWEQLREAGELSSLEVMRANMEFFHYHAA